MKLVTTLLAMAAQHILLFLLCNERERIFYAFKSTTAFGTRLDNLPELPDQGRGRRACRPHCMCDSSANGSTHKAHYRSLSANSPHSRAFLFSAATAAKTVLVCEALPTQVTCSA